MKTTFQLASTEIAHTPSIFRLCKENWAFPTHRKWIKTVLGSYNLAPQVIVGLMNGKIPVSFEGDAVVFEYAGNPSRL